MDSKVYPLSLIGFLLFSACDEDSQGPCDGVSCSEHGTCVVVDQSRPYCECEEGYRSSGLDCEPISSGDGDGDQDTDTDMDVGTDAEVSPDAPADADRDEATLPDGDVDSDGPNTEHGCVPELVNVPQLLGPGTSPSIAWSGQSFVLVWVHGDRLRSHIMAAAYSSEGLRSIDPAELITVGVGEGDLSSPKILWNPSSAEAALVYVQASDSGTGTVFGIVAASLASMLSSTTVVSSRPFSAPHPDIVWTGTEYGLVTERAGVQGNVLLFSTLDEDAEVAVEPTVVRAPVSGIAPSLSWNSAAGRFALVWHEDQSLLFAELTTSGTMGSDPLLLTVADGATHPRIAWGGQRYGLTGRIANGQDPFFAPFDGLSEPTPHLYETHDGSPPILVARPNAFTLFWHGTEHISPRRIYTAHAATAADPQPTSQYWTLIEGEDPAAAWGEDRFGLVWSQDENLYFQVLGCQTTP